MMDVWCAATVERGDAYEQMQLAKIPLEHFACLLPSADFLVLLAITGMWDLTNTYGLLGGLAWEKELHVSRIFTRSQAGPVEVFRYSLRNSGTLVAYFASWDRAGADHGSAKKKKKKKEKEG